MAAMPQTAVPDPARTLAARLEVAGVVLLFLAALYPRLRDFDAPFDRQFEGFQGAFFATCAINYERLGVGALAGYPVVNVALDPERPETWYEYANHPPAVPLLAWASARAFGPEGWRDAWREERAPVGLEPSLRLPFLALHLVGLLAAWWAVREAHGPRPALLTLALLAVLPLSALYATLVNYENPALAFVLLGTAFFARWAKARERRSRALAAAALCFGLAGCVTYTGAFFVVALVLERLVRRRVRDAILVAAALGGATLVPLAVHAVCSAHALELAGASPTLLGDRVGAMLGPLLDGSVPLPRWLAAQLHNAVRVFSWPLVACAAAGAVLALVPRRARGDERERVSLALPLFAGGALTLFAFYRHTSSVPGQDNFFLNVAPGACALAALVFDRLATPLARLRAGIAPLVVAVGLVAMPALARMEALRYEWRAPGPADVPPGAVAPGPPVPLPVTNGRELAELLPPRSATLYPEALGLNTATFYYAWRTMYPIAHPDGASLAQQFFHSLGLERAPTYLALPRDPPPAARPGVESLRAAFAERLPALAERPPERETARWVAYRLNPDR